MKKYLIGLICLLTTVSCHAANFIAVSDIHFNPFYSCKENSAPCPLIVKLKAADATQWAKLLQQYDMQNFSAYGSDTNYKLLQSALIAVKKAGQQSKPNFVIILGDFIAHKYQANYQLYASDHTEAGYQKFVLKTLQFLTIQIEQTFPTIPVYPVIGNNDSYVGDYDVVPHGAFFKDMTTLWQPLLKNPQNEKSFARIFPVAGYYTVTPPGAENAHIIILDSIIFSQDASSKTLHRINSQELAWLQTQLQKAARKKQKVWLVMHIPVGIDPYKTAIVPFHAVDNFWPSVYTNKFLRLLNQYSSSITGVLTSHVHTDGFILLGDKVQLLDSFVPAISPIFGNNPAFKIYQYNPENFQLQNFKTYFLDLNEQQKKWQLEYDFNKIYQPNCRNCKLINGMKKITKKGALAAAYQKYYTVGHLNAQPVVQKWLPYYWCALWNVTEKDYKTCLK